MPWRLFCCNSYQNNLRLVALGTAGATRFGVINFPRGEFFLGFLKLFVSLPSGAWVARYGPLYR